jgi:hypothetical protein
LVIFFFPETQYYCDKPLELRPDVPEITANGKEAPTVDILESVSSIPPKKSFLQELKPWSGINPGGEKNTSILFLFLRPWPCRISSCRLFIPCLLMQFGVRR